MALVAKVLHQLNTIPGVRLHVWHEYRCAKDAFVDVRDPAPAIYTLERNDLPLLKVIKPPLPNPFLLGGRFDTGNECWLVECEGRPAFNQWVMVNFTDEPVDLAVVSRGPKGLVLPPRALYLWDAWCSLDFRRRGLNRKAKAFILRHYFERGIDLATLIVEPFNKANLHSIAPLGFRFERRLIEFELGHRVPG